MTLATSNFDQVVTIPFDDLLRLLSGEYAPQLLDQLTAGQRDALLGARAAFQDELEAAREDAYDSGKDDGYQDGFDEGEEQGRQDGYESGKDDGLEQACEKILAHLEGHEQISAELYEDLASWIAENV